MSKVKFEKEYVLRSSPNVLYNKISTAAGLSEWFADNVAVNDNVFTFEWDGAEERAKLLKRKKGDYVRFQWEDDEGEDYYFEMRINIDELTKDVALIVTDFAEEDELEEAQMLWDKQIDSLILLLGA
ncbi:MAG: SRPBCC domain-containing protein [Bacteroidetes bacterium]|nr:MAG: SRPBCC domain-containing protein [Bacteroidota bacterium]